MTEDQIKEKYLERAIRELNTFAAKVQECTLCPRGSLMPVLGSGHPMAEIFMLKYAPQPAEIEEGVAFYGRSGIALMKSLKRLSIDPLTVYGTLCVKCPVADTQLAADECVGRVREELTIVGPKMVVAMGQEALTVLNELEVPLSRQVEASEGELQSFTPSTAALFVPNIDDCLDESESKQQFWQAFQRLGEWYKDLPPY